MATPSPTATALAKILAENMACNRRIDALKAQIAEDRRVIGDALEFLAKYKIPDTHPDAKRVDVEQLKHWAESGRHGNASPLP